MQINKRIMTYCVALTGNIACGKSTVTELFQRMDVPIFNADHIAKSLTQKGTLIYEQIVEHFGKRIIYSDQQLDRRTLRTIIFNDPQERQWLENTLHPEIRNQLKSQVKQCVAPYCLAEIPLLQSKKDYPYIQRILLVTSSQEKQIERVMRRDHCDREHALAIIAAQPSIEERMELADDVLINDSELDVLYDKVKKLHYYYSCLADSV